MKESSATQFIAMAGLIIAKYEFLSSIYDCQCHYGTVKEEVHIFRKKRDEKSTAQATHVQCLL